MIDWKIETQNKKYTKWYENLIERAKNRILPIDVYTENHHIIPKSLGGSDSKDNLVRLTAREHFICHWLLVKITEGEARSKMVYALHVMRTGSNQQERYDNKITSRVFERYRTEYSKISSEANSGENNPMFGKIRPDEWRKNHSERMKGENNPMFRKTHSDEWRKNNSVRVKGENNPMFGKDCTGEKNGFFGKKHSEEWRKKRSIEMKNRYQNGEWKISMTGYKSINKDGIEKKVKRDTLDQWLAEGWQLGGKKRK